MVNIVDIDVRESDGAIHAVADITVPGRQGEAWYRLPSGAGTDLDGATDAFFIIGLLLAMGTDGVLTMDQPVSRRLLYSSRRAIQGILLNWHGDKLRRAEIDVPAREADPTPDAHRTVTCFTGGADSFDTLINNADDVEALLFVHGFDIPLRRTEIREATSAHLREVAAETGKELIEVETNIRRFLNHAGSWPGLTHGGALSSVGHLLSGRFGRILLPASHTYAEQYPWGTDPMLDHLWSSNRLTVVTDGSASTRVEKIVGLAEDPVAQRHLRVCWQNTGKYNCSSCDKCVRTMITLSIAGVLPEFRTFDSEVPHSLIREKLQVSTEGKRAFARNNIAFAEERGHTEMAAVLRGMLEDRERRIARRAAGKSATGTSAPAKQAPAKPKQAAAKPKQAAAKLKLPPADEKRLAAYEKRIAAIERQVDRMYRLLPIRTWERFVASRHEKRSEG